MSKQTRRTVSLPGPLFWALRAYCKRTDQPVARVVTELVREYLERHGAPVEGTRPHPDELHCGGEPFGGAHAGSHFTW